MRTNNYWIKSADEIMDLCYVILTSDVLNLTSHQRRFLVYRIILEREPISRERFCAIAGIGAGTFCELDGSLKSLGWLHAADGPANRARRVYVLPPMTLDGEIADAMTAARAAREDIDPPTLPVRTVQPDAPLVVRSVQAETPACTHRTTKPVLPVRTVQPESGENAPLVRTVQPNRGINGAVVRSVQADDPPHITTRARAPSSPSFLSLEEKKVERVVVEDTAPTSLFGAEEMGEGARINGAKIVWTDPKTGAPQHIPFRLLDSIVPPNLRAEASDQDLREWARAEIDIAIAEGKDGNLSRWLRAVVAKSWPRWIANRRPKDTAASLAQFAPKRRPMSDKLEPWEG
jgi:hypothetical protein